MHRPLLLLILQSLQHAAERAVLVAQLEQAEGRPHVVRAVEGIALEKLLRAVDEDGRDRLDAPRNARKLVVSRGLLKPLEQAEVRAEDRFARAEDDLDVLVAQHLL
eukprot:5472797-Prymnesium_polylepis.1